MGESQTTASRKALAARLSAAAKEVFGLERQHRANDILMCFHSGVRRMTPFFVLIVGEFLVTAIYVAAFVTIHRKYGEDARPSVTLPTLILVVALYFSVVAVYVELSSNPAYEWDSITRLSAGGRGLVFTVCFMFVPSWAFGPLIARSVGFAMASKLFLDSSIIEPQPSDYSKARAHTKQGDIQGALREYRRYFEENPKRPAPLFAAATMLETKNLFEQAASYYREITVKFESNTAIWSEATLRHGDVLSNHLDMDKKAEELWRGILKRARGSSQAKMASERLMRRVG
jgi:tetratricopeptide (TPR) repeat protein